MEDLNQSSNYKQFWAVGSGSSGLLLNGSLEDIYSFKQVDVKSIFGDSLQITSLEIDGMMGFYLNSKGEVFKFGECEYDEKNKPVVNPVPQQIKSFSVPVIKISCGWSHAMFVDANHQIYGVGSNKFGEIGLGNSKKLSKDPQLIQFTDAQLEDVVHHEIFDIKCAFRQSFIITKQKKFSCDTSQYSCTIYCTGQNKSFELGGFKGENIIYNFKQNQFLLETVRSIQTFVCGYKFACILNSSKQLYGWGDNKYGQLTGDEANYEKVFGISNDVIKVSAGWNHLLILKDDKKLYSAGRGDMGQIGDGLLKNQNSFIQIQGVEGDIELIQCGSEANYVKSNKGIYVWGWNEHGNLGNGKLENLNQPTLLDFQNYKQINQIKSGGAVCYLIENNMVK
ncbi:hypothetical protein ABPG72_011908 [Tetrahymena utriculariae]